MLWVFLTVRMSVIGPSLLDFLFSDPPLPAAIVLLLLYDPTLTISMHNFENRFQAAYFEACALSANWCLLLVDPTVRMSVRVLLLHSRHRLPAAIR